MDEVVLGFGKLNAAGADCMLTIGRASSVAVLLVLAGLGIRRGCMSGGDG